MYIAIASNVYFEELYAAVLMTLLTLELTALQVIQKCIQSFPLF